MTTNELWDFMQSATSEMQSEYVRIQKRSKEDPGTAGDQGEENWATLLKEWLPPLYQVVTKGRILGDSGRASPQVDVIVLHSTYPRRLLDKKLFLAGGVAAAFECKLTLKAEHFQKVFENASLIRELAIPRSGTAYNELQSPIIYGLLAHSHVWKTDPIARVAELIRTNDHRSIDHPRKMPDLICVADLACWISMKSIFRGVDTWYSMAAPLALQEPHKLAMQQKPIGAMLTYFLMKLAWEDESLRNIARYFYRARVAGPSFGAPREWSESVFTQETATQIKALTAEIQQSKFKLPENELREWWNEWGIIFP